jgi:hydroxymethylglutaryl-CoA lyase
VAEIVKIVECTRDAWQGLPGQIPSHIKTEYLRTLISAGFKHIDGASFVSPKAVPQMSDSEEVLKELDPPDDVELIGIVVNEKGAQRAVDTHAIKTLGFPYSVSPTFLRNNQNQTLEDSIEELEKVIHKGEEGGLDTVVYISMAFGNPYGDEWNIGEVIAAVDLLESCGVRTISLADTVGIAGPAEIRELVGEVISKFGFLEIGVHLHSRTEQAKEKILAAYDAGCRRFDSALGGLGGCPFAQDELVGNIPTESVVEVLTARGATLPTLKSLDVLLRVSRELGSRYSNSPAAPTKFTQS